jgi:hypothetical protein
VSGTRVSAGLAGGFVIRRMIGSWRLGQCRPARNSTAIGPDGVFALQPNTASATYVLASPRGVGATRFFNGLRSQTGITALLKLKGFFGDLQT